MFRKFLSLTLVVLLINVAGATQEVRAGARLVEQTRNVGRVKEKVRKIEIGDEARLELKLWDGRKVKVYLHEAKAEEGDDFTAVDMTSGAAKAAYAAVTQFRGGGRLNAAKVGFVLAQGALMAGAMSLGFNLIGLVLIPKS